MCFVALFKDPARKTQHLYKGRRGLKFKLTCYYLELAVLLGWTVFHIAFSSCHHPPTCDWTLKTCSQQKHSVKTYGLFLRTFLGGVFGLWLFILQERGLRANLWPNDNLLKSVRQSKNLQHSTTYTLAYNIWNVEISCYKFISQMTSLTCCSKGIANIWILCALDNILKLVRLNVTALVN